METLVLEKAKRFTGRNDDLFIATMLGLKHLSYWRKTKP